ncbi:hypothetical protein HELRODRAFT_179954 [Helobdella robusta]|uniref:Uncharacterized protein n=1 Tax=Helobdella robusta TaxID=6412 RepID=T1FFA3_HELRO|nr:hypothetical protein HELRODRAFT_179954 [Helobdella robusta]ESN94858.1 hypothetical protein HELRODRAFT_179954 [Helobdella robusta]
MDNNIDNNIIVGNNNIDGNIDGNIIVCNNNIDGNIIVCNNNIDGNIDGNIVGNNNIDRNHTSSTTAKPMATAFSQLRRKNVLIKIPDGIDNLTEILSDAPCQVSTNTKISSPSKINS